MFYNASMTGKSYNKARVILSILIAVIASNAVVNGNLIIVPITILIGLLIKRLLVKHTKEVLEDERNQLVGLKAARITVNIVSIVLMSISFLLISLTEPSHVYLYNLGIVLSYTTVFILAVYSVSYWFINKDFS